MVRARKRPTSSPADLHATTDRLQERTAALELRTRALQDSSERLRVATRRLREKTERLEGEIDAPRRKSDPVPPESLRPDAGAQREAAEK